MTATATITNAGSVPYTYEIDWGEVNSGNYTVSEAPDTLTVDQVDRITRRIQNNVFRRTGVILTGIGVYSYNTSNDEAAQMRNRIQDIIEAVLWGINIMWALVNAPSTYAKPR